MSSRRYIDSILLPLALSFLRQNQRRHDNAQTYTARLSVNFLAANIILVLELPSLSQDMSMIERVIATLKAKGIAV